MHLHSDSTYIYFTVQHTTYVCTWCKHAHVCSVQMSICHFKLFSAVCASVFPVYGDWSVCDLFAQRFTPNRLSLPGFWCWGLHTSCRWQSLGRLRTQSSRPWIQCKDCRGFPAESIRSPSSTANMHVVVHTFAGNICSGIFYRCFTLTFCLQKWS